MIRDHLATVDILDCDILPMLEFYAKKFDDLACIDERMSPYFSTTHDSIMDIIDIYISHK